MLAKKAQDVVQLSQWDLLYFTAVFNCCIFAPLFSSEARGARAGWNGDDELSDMCSDDPGVVL